MKRKIAIHLAFSLALYLFISFVKWDIIWARNIPVYDGMERFVGGTIWLIFHYFVWLIRTTFIDKE